MIDQRTFNKFAADPAAFRAALVVDVDGIAKRFGDCMDPWQRDDFAALDPALKLAAGRSKEAAQSRAYLERPRGHSKTTDLGVICCWALTFATRPLRGYCYAADRDQAKLLQQACATLIRLNPWLSEILSVETNRIVNKAPKHPGEGGTLTIEASDVGSSFGILPDLIIADELCHWEGDGSLWHSLISSAAKRSNCMLVCISNAGFIDSWQWAVREAARTDEGWYFSRLDGPQASWMSEKRLAEQRRMLPAIAYARLWLNAWSASGGDCLTPSDVAAAFDDSLSPMTGKEHGWVFVAGVDLGLVRDFSACTVLAVPEGGTAGRIRLACHRVWRPSPGRKIDLSEIETYLLDLDEQFGIECIGFDPWQAEHMAQRLEADSGHRRRNARRLFGNKPWMREIPPVAANLRAQATLMIESFQDRRLSLYPCDHLRNDLLRLRVEEMSYGLRLVSPRTADGGHGDLASSFSLALLIGHELAGIQPVVASVSNDGFDDEDDLSPIQRAIRRCESQDYLRERENQPEDGQESFRRLMKLYGRL